ncbi:MAG TPA: hypothetical protein VKB86_12725 [Pyrinomonadaceae bacterium]|nr:hypothetical protein [Pyrinomonadaceae bacterium]
MKRATLFLRKLPIELLLAVPVIFYLTLAVYWQSKEMYTITGDEPHYLLVADSIVRDHDLRVLNNYMIDTPVQRAIKMKLYVPEQMPWHVQNQFSRHNPGLPFLLAIPYAIAGVTGAKIFMALLAGLWPFLLYKVLFQITDSKRWSIIIAFTLGVGLPFTAASNQIYPDLFGGAIILYVAEKIFGRFYGRYEEPFSIAMNLWLGALVGFLPWLHVRLLAPAVLLLLAHIYAEAKLKCTAMRTRHYPFAAVVAVCFFALLFIYNRIAFGKFMGAYASDSVYLDIKDNLMIFFGLHWDQSQGMFIEQPLLLLGLVGVVPLVRANWRGAALLALLYLSVILPNAVHPAWYGGFSFPGRFFWTVVALWVFPLAFTVKYLLKRQRLLLKLFCATSIILQAWYAAKWIFNDNFLLNQRFAVWTSRSFFENTRLLFLLPSFKDFDVYLKHPANYVAVLAGLLLIITGWLWQRGAGAWLGKVWAAFLVAGVIAVLLVPVPNGSISFGAYELPSNLGTLDGLTRVATEKDGAGTLTFGPYVKLLAGLYEVTVEYESSATSDSRVGRFDIVYSPGVVEVGAEDLPPSSMNQGIFKYRFQVEDWQSLNSSFEFRVWYAGRGLLRVKGLTLTPISLER